MWTQALQRAFHRCQDRRRVVRIHIVQAEELIGILQAHGDEFTSHLGIEEIGEAEAIAGRLVGVGWTDPATGGSDRELAPGLFLGGIKIAVIRQDDMGPVGDEEVVRTDGDTLTFQGSDLLYQAEGIEDHPITNHILFAGPENAGRDKVEDVFVLADNDGVSGIVAALAADNEVGTLCQVVNNLAFAFVTPLEPVNDRIHE